METFWFAVVAGMLAVYVVLDGFDFGAGMLHRIVARTDDERRTVLAAIGPYWDANEVWLIAAGGVLFFAFPRAYSAAFSGFYMPLMMVLWLLILRGLSIELRSHHDNPLWREFWDATLTFASLLMALVLGTSLGNVVRGVPLDEAGFFAIPLFTDLVPGPQPGVFDWYTLLVGAFAVFLLAGHGALYLVWKTSGPVHDRSRILVPRLWTIVVVLWLAVTAATVWLRRELYANLLDRPWTLVFVILLAGGLLGVFRFHTSRQERNAFLASTAFILGILAATMAGNFPNLLTSTVHPGYSVTAYNAATGAHGLRVGLVWWTVGITLAVSYFVFQFWIFAGKVRTEDKQARQEST